MHTITKINEKTWSIEDDTVRCFVLEGTNEAIMIDTGMNLPNAKEIAEGLTKLPLKLINTHSDPDHISGNEAFESFYMHEADAYPYYHVFKKTGTLLPVHDGDEIDLGDRLLRVIEIPGHTPGSIGVLDVTNKMLFSGDPIQDGRIFMFGPGRDKERYVESLKALLKNHADEFDFICPSHGSCPVQPELISDVIKAAEEVFAGKREGKIVQFFGKDIVMYQMECTTFLCDVE